ncbi:MAG: hypothetical protein FWE31_05975 [Firmicutes bacterium]|nr:hypothetical protein [Bacillota bacterium]
MAKKRLFHDDIERGSLKTSLTANNQIRGVFGEVIDMFLMPRDDGSEIGAPDGQPNVIARPALPPTYNVGYTVVERVGGQIAGIMGQGRINITSHAWYEIPKTHFKVAFDSPIKNVQEITGVLVFEIEGYFDQFTGGTQTPSILRQNVARTVHEFAEELIGEETSNAFVKVYPFGQNPPAVELPNGASYSTVVPETKLPFVIENVVITDFGVEFDYSISFSREDLRSVANMAVSSGWLTEYLVDIRNLKIKGVEFNIRGDVYRQMIHTFHFGETENAYEIKRNTLITTKSNVNGQPLHEFRANEILRTRQHGLQEVALTKVLREDISELGDTVDIMDCAERNLQNEKAQTMARYRDGEVKEFDMVHAEFEYDGSARQHLKVLEEVQP